MNLRFPELDPSAIWEGWFVPGTTWMDWGTGRLRYNGSNAREQLEHLVNWLEELSDDGMSSEDSSRGSSVRVENNVLICDGPSFVKVLAFLGETNTPRLDPSLQWLLRLQRLALDIVDAEDVMAFAAPLQATYEDIMVACKELSEPDETSLGSWTSERNFAACWLPAWRSVQHLALRRLSISEYITSVLSGGLFHASMEADRASQDAHVFGSERAGEQQRASGSQKVVETLREGERLVDVWLWCCIDTFTRAAVMLPEKPADDSVESGRGYLVMYRGEADVLNAWERSLAVEPRVFEADGWLVWRTLKQAMQSGGWSAPALTDPSGAPFYHLRFDLVPPPTGSESVDWKLRYSVQHVFFATQAPLAGWWVAPDRHSWQVERDWLMVPDTWMLPKLREAAGVCTPIAQSLSGPAPYEATIAPERVFRLLTEDAPRLTALGCQVELPPLEELKASDIRIRIEVRKSSSRSSARAGSVQARGSSWFDRSELVEFDWKVAVGDRQLSTEEFQRIVSERSPFVQIGGTWKLIPLTSVVEQMEGLPGHRANTGTLVDVLRMMLLNQQEDTSDVTVDVAFDEEVRDVERVVRNLLAARRPQAMDAPSRFHGTLRAYQQFGFEWLMHLRNIGCGGVLADDMGLGKTIQVLAYWSHLKQNQLAEAPHLLICPTSLLQNWRAELHKFTPELKMYVHHGSSRVGGGSHLAEVVKAYDIVMTTYATAVRDAETLTAMSWDSVVVDEAQNIKNPETKQAQVICQLQARHRIALTGTPIENRLEELWSIYRFAIPGYLGNLAWFRRQFIDAIVNRNHPEASKQLHQLLQPVLLRRSKSDPGIQLELPEKWEVREYTGLTSEQGALYQSVVNQLFHQIEGQATSMSRRGQILAALVRLKQICDHPCLAVGGSSSSGRSGKLKLLLDLLEDVVDEGESALIFTQFRVMGEILQDAVQQRFGWRPGFLHGGLTSTARGELVDAFQAKKDPSPVLVLSLKAGGVGLNLTRANHVFHFDRWWNPAVEDQATDRVFRIGQTRNVQVHKLVCPGTLEERIDELIRSKRQLSSVVVGESEGWLTEMDNAALMALFALDSASAVEEVDE